MDHQDITTETLKWAVAKRLGVPVSQQRLVFAGRQLEDDQTLGHRSMQTKSTVHLVERRESYGYAAIGQSSTASSMPGAAVKLVLDLVLLDGSLVHIIVWEYTPVLDVKSGAAKLLLSKASVAAEAEMAALQGSGDVIAMWNAMKKAQRCLAITREIEEKEDGDEAAAKRLWRKRRLPQED